MEALAGIAGAVAVVVLVLVLWGWAPWRPLLRRQVLLVTRTETTIGGVLWQKRGPLIVLRNARVYLQPGAEGTPVDGEMVVERDKIEWMQVVG